MNFSSLDPLTVQVCTIARSDRWRVAQRLQELEIPCHCQATGQLTVAVPTPTALIQLRSVVQSMTAPRQELIDWLDHCWQTPLPS